MNFSNANAVTFENKYVKFEISSDDSRVLSIRDKQNERELKAGKAFFFELTEKKNGKKILPQSLALDGDVLTVNTEIGSFDIKVSEKEEYFTFELLSCLPERCFKLVMANARYVDCSCKAVGIPQTYWVNPCFFPDGKALKTCAEVTRHLRDKNAKYALIVAPANKHREILSSAAEEIDKRYGIKTCHGGPWATESKLNYGNSTIIYDSSPEFISEHIDFFKNLSVDQLDFHKCENTFRQGDFAHAGYESHAEFKKNVSDLLLKNGIYAGLHTYSFYIDYECAPILSNPEYQKDLGVISEFTLSRDVDEKDEFLPTRNSLKKVCDGCGFFDKSTPYVLVDEEIIKYEKTPKGFAVVQRGACGTIPKCHKKGAVIKYIDGFYHGIAPVIGSNLFYQIARNTAKAFNEGGFSTIYLDAFDAIIKHCNNDEVWFYMAAFLCEMISHCERDPMIEASIPCPSIWLSRGRFGAYDTVLRGYKKFISRHAYENQEHKQRHVTTTLGWYDLYPYNETEIPNLHTKYQHTDAVHHLGTTSITEESSLVFCGANKEKFEKIPALRRNFGIYKMYDSLRKSRYFSSDIIEKVRKNKNECHIEKKDENFVFVEKNYVTKKLYDLSDNERNKACVSNPFKVQTPFVRIEALLSAEKKSTADFIALDETKSVVEQTHSFTFDDRLDHTGNLAKIVTVRGNGKKGSAVCIRIFCDSLWGDAFYEFMIDTDFEGTREFVLVESDNGERDDLPFDATAIANSGKEVDGEYPEIYDIPDGVHILNMGGYAVYRTDFNHDKICGAELLVTKQAEDVKVSSIKACPHIADTIKNPSVSIGKTEIVFDCELKSGDFIEFDGSSAKLVDSIGNETEIPFFGTLTAPEGNFDVTLRAQNSDEKYVHRAKLTLGFTGDEIK